ncbi:MAG TPA: serine hydrolase domain-containing protein [Bryobacteraceae bacterium]|nr:serine hydrolase domain-containing protein [Bryobacteraceae bacterium]
MRLLPLCGFFTAGLLLAADAYPPPRFTDTDRVRKLESALPEVDQVFRRFASETKVPGIVWGVVIDGRLAHIGTAGVRDRASGAPVTAGTVFRIASMTKSFTALAILKLRDDGKLSLEDPVSKWIPEFARMELPTRDTAPLRIRHLLSHSAGFPEDNPWGDQQLGATDAQLTEWLRRGIPFSTPPGTQYEYSNYGFALLGRIVTQASGMPYEKYVRAEILDKLHMDASTFESSSVPSGNRATGYRLQPDGTYREEAPLPHGAFGSMGGLLTSAADLGKYVAFHLSAWPPRDDAETGPVRRASVREMSHMWTPANLVAERAGGVLTASTRGYGYGLGIAADCRFEHIVSHGGGLPGFGSYMSWLPDYGVGMFAMTNLTYMGPSGPINQAWDVLRKTGGLEKRELPPAPVLTEMQGRIVRLWKSWDDAEAKQIAAMNLFLDAPPAQRRAGIEKLKSELGECGNPGPVIPENWLRGKFNMSCKNGTLGVSFTLAPTQPPAVQFLSFHKLDHGKERASAPSSVACRE